MYAISAVGEVVGAVYADDGTYHAIVWGVDGVPRDLGDRFNGAQNGLAFAINSKGDLAGAAFVSSQSDYHAFLIKCRD